MKYDFIKDLKEFIKKAGLYQNVEKALEKYNERKEEKTFSIEDHFQAIIYSLLSNQRPWKRIEENKDKIDKIFFNYDVQKIKNADPQYFIDSLKEIKCGNRNIRKQMQGLRNIIFVLERIAKEYGSIDNYFNHPIIKAGLPYYIVNELAYAKEKYKLKNMGIALVCEYLKNIGIDIAKPDTHIIRILGKDVLGFIKKKYPVLDDYGEALIYIKEIAKQNQMTQIEVDQLLWLYCADGYGEICTKNNPKCDECVIKEYCRKTFNE